MKPAAILLRTLFLSLTLGESSFAQSSNIPSARNPPKAPEDLIWERDIAYNDDDPRQVLNLIAQKKPSSRPRPAVVLIHGGGWSSNDHYRYSEMGFMLAEEGYVVITPTHRMIVDAPFPACLEDIKNAIRWLRANADKYNVDPDAIGAYGNSSGGTLALTAALTGDSGKFEGKGSHRNESSALQCVIASGVVGDMAHDDHSELAKKVYRNLCGGVHGASEREVEKTLKEASPITYVDRNAPPIILVHGERDNVVHIASTDEFVQAMKTAHADIDYLRYDDGGHSVMTQKSTETTPAMLKFLRKHL
jgi:acetyl esterase/lipase